MSTRGLVGFVVEGVEKIGYSHYDNYPRGVGAEVLRFLHQQCDPQADGLDVYRRAAMQQAALAMVLVTEDHPPTMFCTNQIIERLAPRWGHTPTDWLGLLQPTMGKPEQMLRSGYCLDSTDFAQDSLSCEWAYIINLDDNILEVYRGFQTAPHDTGRFAHRQHGPDPDYYPIKLVASFPFDDLPDETAFVSILEMLVREEEEDADPDSDDDEFYDNDEGE